MEDNNYQTLSVRDLAWALLSPQLCLLTPPGQQGIWSKEVIIPFLDKLDKKPERLESYLREHSQPRLGIYFELLLAFYLQQCSGVAQVYSAVRIQSPERTLGEFDLLYRPIGSDSFTSLEVCVKFYLSTQSGKGACHWLGLNPTDCLADKVAKMQNHQLKQADLPESKKVLATRGISVNRKLSIFRGRLFYHVQRPSGCECPDIVESSHLSGWWAYQEEFLNAENSSTRYLPLNRMQWLATQPITRLNTRADTTANGDAFAREKEASFHESFTRREATERLGNKPMMLACLEETEQGWIERDRGVVVPRSWPI